MHRWFVGSVRPSCGWGREKRCHRHPNEPKNHALGLSRGGFGSKFHLVTNGRGLPLKVEVTDGQVHVSTCVESVMNQITIPQPFGPPHKWPSMFAGDKGYSYHCVRNWLSRYGITPLVPRNDKELLRYDGCSMFDKRT